MSETRFTLGPWRVSALAAGEHVYSNKGEIAWLRSYMGISDDEIEANAHLIAAAPDLYAVLSEAMDRGGLIQMCLYEKALAALAKARGEVE